MGKTFPGAIPFSTNFDVQTTLPLDNRLVVDSFEDLTNGTIEAPYQGMVVNIKGTSELWILKTSGIAASHDVANWELVTGSGTDSGTGLGKYSIPVMTPEMVDLANSDPDVDFDASDTPHILIDDFKYPNEEESDFYMETIRTMAAAIEELQAEINRLRNTFIYGIDSYKNTDTAKGTVLGSLDSVEEREPLWAIDPGYLSEVGDNTNFYTGLDNNNTFIPLHGCTIDTSTDEQLKFINGSACFYDGKNVGIGEEPVFNYFTLKELIDSKLITYLVTDKPDVKLTLVSIEDKTKEREIDLSRIISANTDKVYNRYGFCIVISRKVSVSNDEMKGFNYVFLSIIDYDTDKKIVEGYLTDDDELSPVRIDSFIYNNRYSIKCIEFSNLTLSRMKFYTKFEDFSEGVITSAPSETDYKYEVAHIAIRSVDNSATLKAVADHLRDNELIWNKATGTLHIKSDGKIYLIGSNTDVEPGDSDDNNNNDNIMTDREIIEALNKMGIAVNVEFDNDGNIVEGSLRNLSMAPISDITFINEDTDKRFVFKVDANGNLVGKDISTETIEEFLNRKNETSDFNASDNYKAYRGFACDYFYRQDGVKDRTKSVNKTGDTANNSDRIRFSSFYAPIITDDVHGCTHSFIELENTSDKDFPLTGVYLHFFNPAENDFAGAVHHLALDGVLKAGGTYLIRGAQHAQFDDVSAFIKVKTYDKEWYENGQLLSFEQVPAASFPVETDTFKRRAYRFCLTYGLPDLDADTKLVKANDGSDTNYPKGDYPNVIINPRFIDCCAYSTDANVNKVMDERNPWYANGGGVGITIKKNTMFRLMFELDPAKQAFNGFNGKDSSRTRYNKGTDIQVLSLDKEFIGYPKSNEIIKIDRYTPKASFENRNIMTDKSQLNKEKPNMVTCSFGVDVYNTRCFNWISCGTFDEYVWIRKQGDTSWTKFQSYTKITSEKNEGSDLPRRKEYSVDVNNTVYARMINRFPGNNVLFTAHKCVVVLPEAGSTPVKYEYVVGRPDKDGKPDVEHTNSVYTFTLYPRDYEGRVYQITDQQGFNWIEYQVWAASAEFLNKKIDEECEHINATESLKVFPILMNTGDMTQSGARINEWLDYYNGGISLFNHLEQMNCVGNNDLCPIDPTKLGTGNDSDKSSSHFFHYFYCFDVKDSDKYAAASEEDKKFFSGESLIVKPHTGSIVIDSNTTKNINVTENKYIPSTYYFKTTNAMYIVVNSEIPISNVQDWFGLCSNYPEDATKNQYVNIYTGIEVVKDGKYWGYCGYFTPVYETLYAWFNSNISSRTGKPIKKEIVAMHEMPFTVITNASLSNKDTDTIPCTRNHPTNGGRLGSNVNQLAKTETRGIYWCSRLLEYFGCKLVIGGHKHTYALSYPIKEKYGWREGTLNGDVYEYPETYTDSSVQVKPMLPTLADEASGNPKYDVSWNIDLAGTSIEDSGKTNKEVYGIADSVPITGEQKKYLNSTKTPYIPKNLYNNYGKYVTDNASGGKFRCCTPLDVVSTNPNYDGFVTYSMCQATGYKLKSNKELPSATQVFSKIIPMTWLNDKNTDQPSGHQLYPMYSVLEFNNTCTELSVSMNRITNIFKTNGGINGPEDITDADKFTQGDYGTNPMALQTLCSYEKEDILILKNKDSFKFRGADADKSNATSAEVGDLYYATNTEKVYECTSNEGSNPIWSEVIITDKMYGKWLDEEDAKSRLSAYNANPTTISDNRYLHIKF